MLFRSKKFGCPRSTIVIPESLEILFEEIRPDCFQVQGNQLLKFYGLLLCTVFWTFEQTPATTGKDRFLPFGFERLDLCCSDFIDGLAHMAHDVKSIQDIECLTGHLCHNQQIRLPHVG